jgi:hypothetical protein
MFYHRVTENRGEWFLFVGEVPTNKKGLLKDSKINMVDLVEGLKST